MARTVELRRHTDHEHDVLTPEGVRRALEAGTRLQPTYDLLISSGAHRATQTLACFLAVLGPQPCGATVDREFWSPYAQLWTDIASRIGKATIETLREADQKLFANEAERFAGALRAVFAGLGDGGRALVVGHSPFIEIAVYGLTGAVLDAIPRGGGVVVTERDGGYDVASIE